MHSATKVNTNNDKQWSTRQLIRVKKCQNLFDPKNTQGKRKQTVDAQDISV